MMAPQSEAKSFDEFSELFVDALRLDEVAAGTYASHHLWTPPTHRSVYGGQLIAHAVEAAHRTVDVSSMSIHSIRITFIDRGISTDPHPILYHVSCLRDGRSFATRLVRAVQDGRKVLLACASFHRREVSGLEHQLSLPSCLPAGIRREDVPAALAQRLVALASTEATSSSSSDEASSVHFRYRNLVAAQSGKSGSDRQPEEPQMAVDVWSRLQPEEVQEVARRSSIPNSRVHLLIAAWLSDFIVASAALVPHGVPNEHLSMIASLDHSIYFHLPDEINLGRWSLFDVRSSWAGNNRGLNHGRFYDGSTGRLWMSVAQETVIRMRAGFVSKL